MKYIANLSATYGHCIASSHYFYLTCFIWILCELQTYKWNEGVIIALVIAIKTIAVKPEKCFRGFNGIRTHGLCVSAAVVHQMSYEDLSVESRPICWIHRTRERNETYEYYVNGGHTNEMKCTAALTQGPWVRIPLKPRKHFSGVIAIAQIARQLRWSHLHFILYLFSIFTAKQDLQHCFSSFQGESKTPESFWSTIKSIWRITRTRYGNVRLDFGQPFSLQVFFLFIYNVLLLDMLNVTSLIGRELYKWILHIENEFCTETVSCSLLSRIEWMAMDFILKNLVSIFQTLRQNQKFTIDYSSCIILIEVLVLNFKAMFSARVKVRKKGFCIVLAGKQPKCRAKAHSYQV